MFDSFAFALRASQVKDFQEAVEFTVCQGERAMAADNKTLGTFRLTGLIPARKGVPQIVVKFDIDANGILSVTAKDKGTNKEVSVTLNPSGGLDESELNRMINDAKKHEKADAERKALMQLKSEADAMTYSLASTLSDHGAKAPADVTKAATDANEALKTALASDNMESIKTAYAAAQAAASALGDAIYKAGVKDSQSGNSDAKK